MSFRRWSNKFPSSCIQSKGFCRKFKTKLQPQIKKKQTFSSMYLSWVNLELNGSKTFNKFLACKIFQQTCSVVRKRYLPEVLLMKYQILCTDFQGNTKKLDWRINFQIVCGFRLKNCISLKCYAYVLLQNKT